MMNASIVDTIFNAVGDEVTALMAPNERQKTLSLLRDVIRRRVELVDESDSPQMKGRIFNEIARDIRAKTKGLNPEQRQQFVLQEHFRLRISPLDHQAFTIAKAYHKQGDVQKHLRRQAEQILSAIYVIANELKAIPQLYNRFAHIISEIIMDCQYVIGRGKVASLRMGRILSKESKLRV
jgi:hypothetical protein